MRTYVIVICIILGWSTILLSDTILPHNDDSHKPSLWNLIYKNFNFLTDFHLDADLMVFFAHKSGYFKQRYFLENNTGIELELLSWRQLIYSVWRFEYRIGMGRKGKDNVFFDPSEIDFGIIPVFEVRTPALIYQFGANHHCFHEIDDKQYSTIYWNRGFLALGSPNFRRYTYWRALNDSSKWVDPKYRFCWYGGWGYYVKKFFGIIRETTLNGNNPLVQEFFGELRYAFAHRRSWVFVGCCKGRLGYWKQDPRNAHLLVGNTKRKGGYGSFSFGLESNFRKGTKGGMLFGMITFDHFPLLEGIPRLSRDQLIEIGVRFFN